MELIPTPNSSNVSAIGYEAGLLRVVFRDSSVYDAEHVTLETFGALMAAKSKGGFIAANLKDKLKRSTRERLPREGPAGNDDARPEADAASKSSGVRSQMQTHEPDDCCGSAISKALLSGALDSATVWECPECGLEWKPELLMFTIEQHPAVAREVVRHWKPVPSFALVRFQRPA